LSVDGFAGGGASSPSSGGGVGARGALRAARRFAWSLPRMTQWLSSFKLKTSPRTSYDTAGANAARSWARAGAPSTRKACWSRAWCRLRKKQSARFGGSSSSAASGSFRKAAASSKIAAMSSLPASGDAAKTRRRRSRASSQGFLGTARCKSASNARRRAFNMSRSPRYARGFSTKFSRGSLQAAAATRWSASSLPNPSEHARATASARENASRRAAVANAK
jgi:hypothetical protein